MKPCLLEPSPGQLLMATSTAALSHAAGRGRLRCMARSRGSTEGLLGGLELRLCLRLSTLGEACTVILCWKSGGCEQEEELRFRGFIFAATSSVRSQRSRTARWEE